MNWRHESQNQAFMHACDTKCATPPITAGTNSCAAAETMITDYRCAHVSCDFYMTDEERQAINFSPGTAKKW